MRWNRLLCGVLLLVGITMVRTLNGQSAGASAAPRSAAAIPQTGQALPPVSCSGGKVTVSAASAILGNILTAIQRCISAKIDFPAEANETIIFDQIGPASAEEVLNRILGNSDFDFVIQDSVADPSKVDSVMVMMRVIEKGAGAGALLPDDPSRPLTAARKAFLAMHENAKPGGPAGDRDNPDRAAAETVAAPGDQAPPAADAADPPPAPVAPLAKPSEAKPSDDRIQAMREMFEQRKQQMQSAGTPPQK